jgi:hypothetical protein
LTDVALGGEALGDLEQARPARVTARLRGRLPDGPRATPHALADPRALRVGPEAVAQLLGQRGRLVLEDLDRPLVGARRLHLCTTVGVETPERRVGAPGELAARAPRELRHDRLDRLHRAVEIRGRTARAVEQEAQTKEERAIFSALGLRQHDRAGRGCCATSHETAAGQERTRGGEPRGRGRDVRRPVSIEQRFGGVAQRAHGPPRAQCVLGAVAQALHGGVPALDRTVEEALSRIDDGEQREGLPTGHRASGILDLPGQLDLRESIFESRARLVEAAQPDQDVRTELRDVGRADAPTADGADVARDLSREGEASGEGVVPRVHLTRRPRRAVARATA